MRDDSRELHYADYLQLPRILDAQRPRSREQGAESHDETLFIITHQAYELWFKQILHELRSILALFSTVPLDEKKLSQIVARLGRILAIQKMTHQQIGILETMTPLDFLDFRGYLGSASGLQSVQFREIELRLGLSPRIRPLMVECFREDERRHLEGVSREGSLFEHLDAWLARMPFLEFESFSFWQTYRRAVDTMLAADEEAIEKHRSRSASERKLRLRELAATRENFRSLFEAGRFEELRRQRKFRLSQRALLSALFINLYRDEPILQVPFRLLTHLMDIDEQLSAWRNSHALMAQRMLGSKMGTGGSSGHEYLRATVMQSRIFTDLFDLATFLIPRSALPRLPDELEEALGFHFSGGARGAAGPP